MSNDPLTIHIDKLAELLRGLGLDPVDMGDIQSIHMAADGIAVVRYRRDEHGRTHAVGAEIATETVTIGIGYGR